MTSLSRFVGYDLSRSRIEIAGARARDAGISGRVRFEERDASRGLAASFDLVTTFDVVHGAADPVGMLAAVRRALRPGGAYLCLDKRCADRVEENVGTRAALLYGMSVLHDLVASLEQGGAGLGTSGLSERALCEMATLAGLSVVEPIAIEHPLEMLYRLRP